MTVYFPVMRQRFLLQLVMGFLLFDILLQISRTKADTTSPPSFITKPSNVTAEDGDTKSFRCKATGYPTPTIKWYKNGAHVTKKTVRILIGSVFKTLYIMPVLKADNGHRITCEASNKYGTITAHAFLTVLTDMPPTWVTRPHDVILYEDQEYTLPCKAKGYPHPSYQWYKGTDRVKWHYPSLLELTNGGLLFYSAIMSNFGVYTCQAVNAWGQETSAAHVKVLKDPTVLLHPNDTIGIIGGTAWLQCGLVGQSLTSLVWMKNGKQIKIPVGSRMSVEGNTLPNNIRIYTLTIRKAVLKDSGRYRCVAANSKGFSRSNEATLNFTDAKAAPRVTIMNRQVIVAKDLDVILNCFFTGTPLPKVRWYKNGQILSGKGQIKETSKTSLVASLEILDVVQEDDGLYICKGDNLAGSASGNVSLMVRGPPSSPTNLFANLTSKTDMKVSWAPGYSGGAVVWYVVEHRRNGSRWLVVETGANTSVILTSTHGWNMTIFRVWASNKYGSSPPSMEYLWKGDGSIGVKGKDSEKAPPVTGAQSSGAAIGGAVGGVLSLVLVAFILLVLWRRKQVKEMHTTLQTSPSVRYTSTQREDEDGVRYDYVAVRQDATLNPQAADATQYDSLRKPINWEVPKRNVQLGKELGKGHFGKVVKAVMKTKDGSVVVAVKMLKDNVDSAAKRDFLSELELMKSLAPHPNIVGLLGCCTKGDSSWIIVEYCSLGNLLDYLRKSQGNRIYSNLAGGSLTLTCRDLLSFMWQIARGMSYLTSLKLVHRDLAARNILMDEGKVCKIADFGLARDIYQENQYLKTTEGELPLRWMAHESIFKGITTIESDVWSFGVLMWEIVTLGANPYPGMTREQLISNLHLGYRMPRPPYCTEELYAVIWECWKQDPAARPTFSMLCRTLNRMLAAEKILIDLATFDAEYINATEEGEVPASPKSPLVE